MKYLYVISAVLFLAAVSSCSNESDDKKEQESASSQKEESGKEGKITTAPIINMSEFSGMSKEDLRLARNTIYAKYGRIFKSKDLKDYFEKQAWYNKRPSFKESEMQKQDKDLVKLIQLWENQTEVVLKERADITGNGSYEDCFVLYNENKGTYAIIVNDFSQEFDHFWGQNDDDQGVPTDWSKIKASIIDIDPEDFKQEVLVSQRYDDWGDPGTHNVIVAFYKGVKVTELSSTDYDAGILEVNGDGTVTMNYSNCPPHTKEYKLQSGKLVMFDETIGPTPPGGCAACFPGDAQISISLNKSIPIEELKRGDEVLTFDRNSKEFRTTKVKRILTVYHDKLYTIQIGGTSIITTDDHPILTENGWCSLAPEKTTERYRYTNVQQLKKGDQVIRNSESNTVVGDINLTANGAITYTIATLENGSNFIVNGVVVGTESKSIIP